MEPQIRYCTTSDGVSIAYAVLGEGPPLVYLCPVLSHLTAEWSIPYQRRRFEWLSRTHTVIRFDLRGSGLSQREGFGDFDYSVDLQAVVNDLSLNSFLLFAEGTSGPFAITYAVTNPVQVGRLLLLNSFASFPLLVTDPRVAALAALVTADWVMFTETFARFVVNWDNDEDARRYAAMLREATTPETFAAYQAYAFGRDATPLLPRVDCPTLVIHNNGGVIPLTAAQAIAASIPHAQARFLNRGSMFYEFSDSDVAPWLEEFLLEGCTLPESNAPSSPTTPVEHASGTAVILFIDIVSSTELTERMGDTGFRDASRALDSGLRAAIRDAGGTTIDGKLLGDGVLATFPSAAQAIDGARRCLTLSDASELGLHIGLHAGDVIREDNNVYGGAVNIASRICGLSAPGEILVSDVVRGMARSSARAEFEDRGEREMKGVGEPVRVYAVRSRA